MRRILLSRSLLAHAFALATLALAHVALAQDAPRDAAAAWTYLKNLPPAQRSAVIEREAKREGSLILYGATGLDRAQFWIGEFNKRYPDIKVEFVRLQAAELYEKVSAEKRTGKLRADMVITTITYLDLLRDVGALAPYETGQWASFDPRFKMGSFDAGWTAVVYEVFPHAIAWRSDRIKEADAPKTLQQVADPKWRGRTGTSTHLEDFLGGELTRLGPEKGMAQIKELAALKNRLYRSHAALSDALASGEIDIAWGLIAARPIDLIKKGAPVGYTLGNLNTAEGNTISVGRDTAKPYAAALVLDVMLSPEVLEASDRWSPGRAFGNRKGKYAISLDQYPQMVIYPALSQQRYKELNRLAEELFVR